MHVHCSSVFVLKHTAQMWWDQSFSLFKCNCFIFLMHLLRNVVGNCVKYDFHFRCFILCCNRKGAFGFLFSSFGLVHTAQPSCQSYQRSSSISRWKFQHQVRNLLVFLLFLDPFNCIHIESKLIRIVQVWLNPPEIIKLREHLTPLLPFLPWSMLPKWSIALPPCPDCIV